MQCPALTCVVVYCQGSGIITRLLWVEVHCYLHGIANPKSPSRAINRERAATQTGTSGLLWDIWGLCGCLAHFSSPAQARSKQTTVSRRKREQTVSETEPPTRLLRAPALRTSYAIKRPRLPHTLHPVLCSKAQESDC